MRGTKTTIGISWRQSLLRKNPATVSWEECIWHLPLRIVLRSKKTVELCGMDYSFPITRSARVQQREKMASARHKMACHMLRQSRLCRSWPQHWVVFQVLSNDPLSSSFENRWILVQRSFQGWVGKPSTWKRQDKLYIQRQASLILNFSDSTSLQPLPPPTCPFNCASKIVHGLCQLLPCVQKLLLQTLCP